MIYTIKNLVGDPIYALECDSWRTCVETAVSLRVDLTNADLWGLDLTGVYLRGAVLNGASFRHSSLVCANLYDAQCINTDFEGAEMSRCNLAWSNCDGANFNYADISGAEVMCTSFKKVKFYCTIAECTRGVYPVTTNQQRKRLLGAGAFAF